MPACPPLRRPRLLSRSFRKCLLGAATLLTLTSAWPGAARAQTLGIGTRVDIPTFGAPTSLAIADFNGDGKPDFAVGSNSSVVSIYLGDGTGRFTYASGSTLGGPSYGLAAADVNGDGHVDLVSTSIFGVISIRYGDGTGFFPNLTNLPSGVGGSGIAIADYNGDGWLDLAVANSNANTVTLYPGYGPGGFGPRTDLALPTNANPSGIAIGDVTGDGKPDLVVTENHLSEIAIFPGDAAGDFGTRQDVSISNQPNQVAIGDVNADGRPDILTANLVNGTISMLLGGPSGFSPITITPVAGPAVVAIADVNGDGYPDLVASNNTASTIEVLMGNGTGPLGTRYMLPSPVSPGPLVVGDLNGDGRPDIVVASATADSVSVYLNDTGGWLASQTVSTTGSEPNLLRLGDLNADGKLDLVTADFLGNAVSVLLGTGGGTFGAKTDYTTGSLPASVAIADVSGDGKPDLITANNGSSSVSVLLGTGGGAFGAKTDFATGLSPISVAVGDVNGDSKPDLVTANASANTVSVLLGLGGGAFGAKSDFTVGSNPNGVAVADVSGDGKLDIVTANYFDNTISVLLGAGNGTFGAKTDFPTGGSPISVAVGDLNGDGIRDIAVADASSSTVAVLLGTGGGSFAAKVEYPTGSNPTSVIITDVDGDGRPDLVTTNSVGNTASVLLGDGAGHFGARTDYPTGTGPNSVAAGDVNGDGRMDLVVANKTASTASTLLGLEPTRTTLTSNPVLPLPGSTFTFTGTTTVPPPGTGTPAGTMSFLDGTTGIGQAVMSGGAGAISEFYTSPPFGHVITARYPGDAGHLASISPPVVFSTSRAPNLTSVVDVPNDQGGQVKLTWDASLIDRRPGDPIDQYWIWRQVPTAMAEARLARGARLLTADSAPATPASGALRASMGATQATYWEFVASPNADGFTGYSYVASTAYDSLPGSNPKTIFMVEARDQTDGIGWASAPDSGYSVDNLAPPTPAPFTGVYASGAATLSWSEVPTPDLAGFALYRGSSAGFTPGPGNLVVAQPTTGYVDHTSAGSYYKLAAVDVHGNASPYALLSPAATTGVASDPPLAFALAGVRPNPSSGRTLEVAFTLAHEGRATIELIDVAGRRVTSREVGSLGVGRHTLDLTEGRALADGVYLVRLTQGTETRTARAAVVQ